MFFDKRVCHPERSAKHVVEGSRPVFLAFFIALLFAACTDYQDEYEDAFRNLVYAEETDDSSSSIEESSSDIDEESSSSKAKSSSSSEESSSSKAKSSSSKEESSSSKAKSSSSSEEGSSSSSSSSVELDSVATLSMLKVFATDPSETEASALLSKDSAGLADSNSFSLAIQAPTAFIKVKPSAKKVAQVKVSAGKEEKLVQPDADGSYSFERQLSILNTTNVEIEVKSENEKTVKKYTLSISSTLAPPTNLKLARNDERTQIIAMFDRAKDSRVDGYVVLRSDRGSDGKQGEDLPDSIENKTRITKDANTYKGFKAFLADSTSNTYVDSVGGGSPYYAYRVYAYTMEGDDMVFSEGTEQHVRSVGRIKVEYRMNDFGGEYCYISFFGRIDIEGKATLYEGRNNNGTELYSWEGYDWHAGDEPNGDTIVYLSDILDQDDRIPNSDKHVSYIGGAGLYLNLEAISDHGEKAEHGIRWPYEAMAAVLNGVDSFATGRDGYAPVQNRDIEYIFGMERIVYDSNHSRCDGCGDDPHAGFKFWFKYDWVDDD